MERRELLAGLGLAAIAGHQVAQAQSQRDNLVFIFLRGGADSLTMLPPHSDPLYYQLRPKLAVPAPDQANGAIDLDGQFGMHPVMAPLKPLFDLGELAFINATGMPGVSRSHFEVQDILERGTEDSNFSSGWLGRHANSISDNASPLRTVSMDTAMPRALLGDPTAAALSNLNSYQWLNSFPDSYYNELEALQSLNGNSQIANSATSAITLMETLDSIQPWTITSNAAYPASNTGNALKQAAQLFKSGSGTEIVHLNINGWDTHSNQLHTLPSLLGDMASSLAAFRNDMGSLMQQTTVIVMTEFGRRAAENANLGTDHGKGCCMLALGAGVNGGQIYGDWPGLASDDLDAGDIRVTTDYRQVIGEFLATRRQVSDLTEIFPGFSPRANIGVFSTL